MENPAWVRMIVVGLVLAILAAGYFLLSGSFVKSKPKIESSKTVVETVTPVVNGAMYISPTPKPSTQSAYNTILNRTQNQNQNGGQGGIQTLPRTGFPVGLISLLSASLAIAGWGLRRFPH